MGHDHRWQVNPAHLQTNLDILQQGPLQPDLYEEAKRRLAAAGSTPQAIAGSSTIAPISAVAPTCSIRSVYGLMLSLADGIKMAPGLVSVSI